MTSTWNFDTQVPAPASPVATLITTELSELRVVGVDVLLVLALGEGTHHDHPFLQDLRAPGSVGFDTILAVALVVSWQIGCCVAFHSYIEVH